MAVMAQDGVVLGADSAATMGALGSETIRQQTGTKVEIVRGQALAAVSGPIGLGQRLIAEVEAYVRNQSNPADVPTKVMTDLRGKFAPHLAAEFEAAQRAVPVIGNQVAARSVLSHSVVAICAGGRPSLLQFDQQGAPEAATQDLPFVCAGSGLAIADPVMGLLRDIYLPKDALPTLADATFVTVWTLTESIRLAPGGLGGPIHLYTLTMDGRNASAREVPSDELAEHQQSCDEARKHMARFREPVETQPPPEPES